jgi:DNA-binding response OmpR family regulator
MKIFVLGSESRDLTGIEAALRRSDIEIVDLRASIAPRDGERRFVFAGWTLDAATRDLVSASGERVDLTSSEFDLLMAFPRQPGQALSRAMLLGALRGRDWSYFDRSIDTMVARLRRKIDACPGGPPLIRSVRGVGYVFCASVADLRTDRPAALRAVPAGLRARQAHCPSVLPNRTRRSVARE